MRQASAREIVRALKGRWGANSGSCRCPAHDDRSPSLSVTELRGGKVLVHCFAGCTQSDVIGALASLGLWDASAKDCNPQAPWQETSRVPDYERRNRAAELWDKCQPITGTLAEKYLRARGVRGPLSDQLRYHPNLHYTDDCSYWPALVARLSDNRGFVCIQRTWLTKDGLAKAPVEKNKKSLGMMGASAVRLRPFGASTFLGLAEGIETALSAAQLYSIPVWATLSAYRLCQIEIPAGVENLTIFADAGETGREQAVKAAEFYESRGIDTEILYPASHFGSEHSDFNDVVTARGR